MAIKDFTFDSDLAHSFITFGHDHYKNDTNWIPQLKSNLLFQLSPEFPFYNKPGNFHKHFIALSNGKISGRISAFVNNELRDKSGNLIGCLGFFESLNNQNVSNDLFNQAINWLTKYHDIQTIWGPVNFDIWNNYRLKTRGFGQSTFLGEPYNKDYYPELFTNFGFSKKQLWQSLEIDGARNLKKMAAGGKNGHNQLLERGYRFASFNKKYFKTELRKLYKILIESFSGFLGFTPISFPDFEILFTPLKHAVHPAFFKFIFDENNNLAGYVGNILDLSQAVRAMKGRSNCLSKVKFLYNKSKVNRIIYYIGGISKNESLKKSGLGKAALYHVTQQVLKAGYNKVVIALMAENNRMQRMLGDNINLAQREYALYEKKL